MTLMYPPWERSHQIMTRFLDGFTGSGRQPHSPQLPLDRRADAIANRLDDLHLR
jgi:hypothetical protein